MANADIIKEYLVSLGFEADQNSYRKFRAMLNEIDSVVAKHAGGMTAAYAGAATAIVGAFASIGLATVGLMNKIAQADLEYKKFALNMFMSKDAAKEAKIAIDALVESVNDIAWIPELRGRYQELIKEQRGMQLPGEYSDQVKYLRDIRFEFTRLKVEMTYGMQWIGFSLFKHLGGPLADAKGGFKKINDWIQQHMPEWTDKIGSFLASVFSIGKSAWRAISNVWEVLKKLWEELHPSKVDKIALSIIGLMGLFAVTGPFGVAVAVISAALLALEDFFGYIDGKKSSSTLAPIWHTILSTIDSVKWNLTLLGRLWDNTMAKLSGGPSKTYSEIWNDTKAEWAASQGWDGTSFTKKEHGLDAIGRHESGNDYTKVNPDTKAYGRYQIMPQNWPEWAKGAGLKFDAEKTPENQEIVAAWRWEQLMKKYNNEQLATVAWYGGEGAANRLVKGDYSLLNKSFGKYPSQNEYIKSVTGSYWDTMKNFQSSQASKYMVDSLASGPTTINVGGVTVNAHTNASAESIGREVAKQIQVIKSGQPPLSIQARTFAGMRP